MNQSLASNHTQEDPKDIAVSRTSSVRFICANIIMAVVIISVTVIAFALVIVRKKRRVVLETESNYIYGTYENGPEDITVTDNNMYYQ